MEPFNGALKTNFAFQRLKGIPNGNKPINDKGKGD